MINRDALGAIEINLGCAVISVQKGNQEEWDRVADLSNQFPMVTVKIDKRWRYHNGGYYYKEVTLSSPSYSAAIEAANWICQSADQALNE